MLAILFEPQLLTHKQLEMHECILSIDATDVLVLKHQDISTHSAVLVQFHIRNIKFTFYWEQH